ncbi:hypothetical protein B0J11DRAFT_619389 [Dendryphion nanum]|uniref:Uncharacterized protein n=1 Tax=Dendryphion nanum TaxID=256645 RepID=A0A9P9IB54_9PLEO|nr:hypothetical protein B0J11DRAFT_619389 [Dendryphion nanum]
MSPSDESQDLVSSILSPIPNTSQGTGSAKLVYTENTSYDSLSDDWINQATEQVFPDINLDIQDPLKNNFATCCCSRESIVSIDKLKAKPTYRVIDRRSWWNHWKTIAAITIFLVIALACAVTHYLLFRSLNGTLTDGGYLTQRQTSSISLLLTTIFKATMTASVGICFTQHLWHILRGTPTSTQHLFFALWHNFFWMLGIAMIYPSGALTVRLQDWTVTSSNSNVSVLNPTVPSDFNAMMIEESKQYPSLATLDRPEENTGEARYKYRGPRTALKYLAKSALTISNAYDLSTSPGENTTYYMRAPVPQFSCTKIVENQTIDLEKDEKNGSVVADIFVISYNSSEGLLNIAQRESVDKFYAQPANFSLPIEASHKFKAKVKQSQLVCRSRTAWYEIKVSYPRGVQKIDYFLLSQSPLPKDPPWEESRWRTEAWTVETFIGNLTRQEYARWPWSRERNDKTKYPQVVRDWITKTADILLLYNQYALLDSLGILIQYTYRVSYSVNPLKCKNEDDRLDDGSNVTNCYWNSTQIQPLGLNEQTPLDGSVFQKSRYKDIVEPNQELGVDRDEAPGMRSSFDPRTLLITEETLNKVLKDIAFSALSLDTWKRTISINTTRYSNTYHFSRPLSLIIPYSLCLEVGVIFAVVGIVAMWRNGAPASDGGFLQVMMATRGDTEMERLVVQQGLRSTDDVSKELKRLEIRYGALYIGDAKDGETRLGFGTVDETMSLRRRYTDATYA